MNFGIMNVSCEILFVVGTREVLMLRCVCNAQFAIVYFCVLMLCNFCTFSCMPFFGSGVCLAFCACSACTQNK